MEANKLDNPAMPEPVPNDNKRMGFSDKLGINDENAEHKIKDTADKVGVIGSVGALVLGFLFWSRANDLAGFLIGLAIVGVGIFVSFFLMNLLYCYGDMIGISIEQTRTLERLEAKNTEELPKTEISDVQQLPAEAPETTELNTADIQPAELDNMEQNAPAEELSTIYAETKKRASDLPLEAAEVDRANRIAHFTERSDLGVICPICAKWQTPQNDACFHCSCKFVFDDEQPDRDGRTA